MSPDTGAGFRTVASAAAGRVQRRGGISAVPPAQAGRAPGGWGAPAGPHSTGENQDTASGSGAAAYFGFHHVRQAPGVRFELVH